MVAFSVPSPPKHRLVLAENLRKRRKALGLTQEQLAEKAGLSVVFISLLENGHRTISVDSLIKLARVLRVCIEDLVNGLG